MQRVVVAASLDVLRAVWPPLRTRLERYFAFLRRA